MDFLKRPRFPFDIPPTCCLWFIEISEFFLALRRDGPDHCIPFVRIHIWGPEAEYLRAVVSNKVCTPLCEKVTSRLELRIDNPFS